MAFKNSGNGFFAGVNQNSGGLDDFIRTLRREGRA